MSHLPFNPSRTDHTGSARINVVPFTTSYPGARAEKLSRTVAAPIEEQLSGVEKLSYFSSTSSSNGNLQITVTFEPGTNVDQSVFNVNNRVQAALARLPQEVQRQGVTVRKQSSAVLQFIFLYAESGDHTPLFLSNYATINIIDRLARVPGVGQVNLFGAMDYSMRIWFEVDRPGGPELSPRAVG